MERIFHVLVLLTGFIALSGCLREDNEPDRPLRPISRLYVSTSEYEVNTDLTRLPNIYVIDPADATDLERISSRYTSGARGGNRILYDPEFRGVFQSAVNNPSYIDTTVQVLNLNQETGLLGAWATIISDQLNAVRGMDYHAYSRQVLFVNSSGASSNILVYRNPQTKRNPVPPDFRVPITGIGANQLPTALMIHDISLDAANLQNITYMTTVGTNSQIVGYNNLMQRLIGDTVVNNVSPDFVLTIPNANNLSGISYSPTLDLLVLTDYTNNQGRILFFENFSSHNTTGSITPSRLIEGSATLLQTPRDVEIDIRENAIYLYVADPGDRSVLRFRIDDEGNVAPNARLVIEGRTPVGISLDARGTIPVEE